ncbi:MAG: 2-succinyl-5-enolpyruvyl-6-hydroxy-3-cyclohexene-1-carboxylic-acid synthase [Cyclobacteriaceae bacterium]|jgi:2-succinyl-5-enolpyruvyl-6-hydroxy-3-cyclohexene-1-carboxylate synthase|nr:2-succinyl-5-enolpyruvyl-6-hydroxy-3-cyclohexene-1-carboxylic-acid synthase [Cyclobacteriaceae bacterium]
MAQRLQPIYDIAELCALQGIREAIICPGSRSAPLTLSFARHGRLHTRVINDERSAAFLALGLARETEATVVLICTSGSAAYNFAPAVAEAFYQHVPLLILTADRPPEWIDQMDGQTIRQRSLFGRHVKKSFHLPHDYDHADASWHINRCLNEAIIETQAPAKGPVHVNVPLREPLYPAAHEAIGYSAVRVIHTHRSSPLPAPHTVAWMAEQINRAQKIIVLPGQHKHNPALQQAITAFGKKTGAVLVADVLANFHGTPAIGTADHFLAHASDDQKKEWQPDLLITLGQSVISKHTKLFLRKYPAAQHVHVQPHEGVADTFQSLTQVVLSEETPFFQQLLPMLAEKKASPFWHAWQALHARTQAVLETFMAACPFSDLATVGQVLTRLPAQASLHVANSMSVRYVNMLAPWIQQPSVRIWANRGTSGIDGCTSSALGHAWANDQLQVLITGDLAFFYDRNAFWNEHVPPNLRIVLLNNHGGVIFSLIDGPGHLPERDTYFVATQRLAAQSLAHEMGLDYQRAHSLEALSEILPHFFNAHPRAQILEVETDIETNQRVFENLKQQIKQSL